MDAGADVSADIDGSEPPPFFAALEGWYLGTAATLGRRTAELHLALADVTGAGVRARTARCGELSGRSRLEPSSDAEAVFDAAGRSRTSWHREVGASADAVLDGAVRCVERVEGLGAAVRGAGRASGSTATITSARCCGPRRISSSSTSKASRRGRSPNAARNTRR